MRRRCQRQPRVRGRRAQVKEYLETLNEKAAAFEAQFEEDVVQGMMEYGVQEAIKVVKNGETLEVVDGRQRTINAREANRRLKERGLPTITVKVFIVRGEDHRLHQKV